jgi:hypothetical protein
VARVEIPQDELLRGCEEEMGRIDEEARRLVSQLTDTQLAWPPPDGGWSIAQVLAHLAVTNRSYTDRIRRAIERDGAAGAARANPAWRPSLLGGMLIRSLEPTNRRRTPSPRMWRPSTDSPAGTLSAFLESQATIRELIRSARDVDLVRARLASPVSRFVRLNVGDAFRIFVVHGWRHLGQIRRVIEREGFPPRRPAPQ